MRRFSFRTAINGRVPKVVHASIPSMCSGTMLSLCRRNYIAERFINCGDRITSARWRKVSHQPCDLMSHQYKRHAFRIKLSVRASSASRGTLYRCWWFSQSLVPTVTQSPQLIQSAISVECDSHEILVASVVWSELRVIMFRLES